MIVGVSGSIVLKFLDEYSNTAVPNESYEFGLTLLPEHHG